MGDDGGGGGMRLLLADFVLSLMWAWSGIAKSFICSLLGFGHHDSTGEAIYSCLSVINMFLFAYLGMVTRGGAYNPITVLSGAISGGFPRFLYTVGARIPVQVFGAIVGVRLIIQTFPEIGRGPRLNVELHHGALTEGILTFAVVIISLGISRNISGSFFRKTWISSLCKLSLHILGSDLTGGCMNPASVMGWAYARGDHLTKEHIIVYWLAPVEATLLAAWTFKLLVKPATDENAKPKTEKTE